MDPSNIAKDFIRIANTAGLSKDVIDLLTAKITLLDEKLVETKAAFSDVMLENQKLRKQLDDLTPVNDALPEPQTKILKVLHQHRDLLTEDIAHAVSLSAPDTKGHLGILADLDYVTFDLNQSMKNRASLGCYRITDAGRAQAMKNG